jgi:hypothetical protein
MAFGTHWEWRGFGEISAGFMDRFGRLVHEFGPQGVDDLYIWAPGLVTNLKIRTGEMGGLKFKRFVARDGRLECWSEDPDELFDFPLTEDAWQMLAAELAGAGFDPGSYPAHAPDRDETVSLLKKAGCRLVHVSKEREGRWWPGPNGRVLVERTAVHKPQPILSISLESEDTRDGLTDDQAKEDLRAALAALGLENESLSVMSYMDALARWND